jgi:quercetin dioxygenase-like cupin family protein
MPIVRSEAIREFEANGLRVLGLATRSRGAVEVMVWRNWIDPGQVLPFVINDREEVVVVLSGSGTLSEGRRLFEFSAGDVLIVPAYTLSRIAAAGSGSHLDCLLAMPLATRHFTPTGDEMWLPWAR